MKKAAGGVFNSRIIKIGFAVILFGLLVITRLSYLVILKGDDYIAMAQSVRMKTIAVNEFDRGNILDTNGKELTNNSENCLVVFPCLINNDDWLLYCFRNMFDDGKEEDNGGITDDWQKKLAAAEPFIVQRNLTEYQTEKYTNIIEEKKLAGAFVLTLCPRYGLDFNACHVIGFVGEANEDELAELTEKKLPESTAVGKSGIEYQYNDYLTGKFSDKIGVAADERSKQISTDLRLLKGHRQKGMGYDVQLTLNKDYQQFLDEAMREKSGGAVLLDVQTGDILAVSSSPCYNQYLGQTAADGSDYINKAFAYYPPASVFKTVLVLAALGENIDCSQSFFCNGSITLGGGHKVGCWEETGHGKENLQSALANSCNPYFVNLGQRLGGRTIMDYAYNLGLGEQKIIGYNVKSLPDNIAFDVRAEADVANVSIGEKGVRLSPLLVAQLMCTVANGGNVVTPRLVKGILTEDGKYIKEFSCAEPRKVIDDKITATLRQYLRLAVTSGTGKPVNSSIVEISGKTGTTQNEGVWFAGFMPSDEPKYAIAVYDENGESGGADAGVVAKEVFEKIAAVDGLAE